VRAATAAAAVDLDALLCGHGYELLGRPELRAAIADRFTARGLPTRPDQVLVTSGAQHAFALILATLTGAGDRVLVEHPTYPNALDAVRARGARPVPVPMGPGRDGTGSWDLDLLTASVRDAAPRLMYVIPDFHNPTGGVLDAAGRERLVALARRTGTPVVLDETMTELALDGPPPTPAASFGGADSTHVLTIGSASKVFWGGLRVGWIRASPPLVRRLGAARAALDLGGPTIEQLVVSKLLTDVDAVVAERRVELVAAREHLLDRLAAVFPSWRASRPERWPVAVDRAGRARLQQARDVGAAARGADRRGPALRRGRGVRAPPAAALHRAPRPGRDGARTARAGLAGPRPHRAAPGGRPRRRRLNRT
jgi:DNA-binding transcriptional MocR family regulator